MDACTATHPCDCENLQILVVDDDPDYHVLISDILSETEIKYEATFVQSIQNAMSLVEERHFDVILLDYMVRPNTGFDLFNFIKNRQLKIPCILLTNYDSPSLDESSFKSGISDLIAKRDLNPGILKRSIIYSIRNLRQQLELERLAQIDVLTQLMNRSSFMQHVHRACEYKKRHSNYSFSILYVDLDYFKSVNDSYGHEVGDSVLREFSTRLKNNIRATDLAARIGGDEFLVLLLDVDKPVVHMVAQKIIKVMEKPIESNSVSISQSVSIGMTWAQDENITPERFISQADKALYYAKISGRSTYRSFNGLFENRVKYQAELERDLKFGIDNDQFKMYVQPRYAADDFQLIGYETLARWQHPEKGLVSPNDFLEGLKRLGLEANFTWLTLDMFFSVAGFLTEISSSINVAFNVFPHQLLNKKFIKRIEQNLFANRVKPESICFEVTEHHLMENLDLLMLALQELRKIGISIALDDFGAKYSSLTMLSKLPIDIIKIDKFFIQNAEQDEKVHCILNAMATVAKSLGLRTVVEGVENENQLHMVQSLHFDEIQGFFLSEPLTVEKGAELIVT